MITIHEIKSKCVNSVCKILHMTCEKQLHNNRKNIAANVSEHHESINTASVRPTWSVIFVGHIHKSRLDALLLRVGYHAH